MSRGSFFRFPPWQPEDAPRLEKACVAEGERRRQIARPKKNKCLGALFIVFLFEANYLIKNDNFATVGIKGDQ